MRSQIKQVNDTFELGYDLHSLPTAQHKAGLAGLVLLIHSLSERNKTPLPKILTCTAAEVRIAVNLESLQTLFNDWFKSARFEYKTKSKRQKEKLKRVETTPPGENGQKREAVYVYEMILPAAEFLQSFYHDDKGAWARLWRDAIWHTLRDRSKTRGDYECTVDGEVSPAAGRAISEFASAVKSAAKGEIRTARIASTIFIGAQDINAEKVPFKGASIEKFLLYFWPLCSLVFVPRSVSIKGEMKDKDTGFVFVVPEISDLESFLDDFRSSISSLRPDVAGIRPKDSLVDLPDEGGLEYLHSLVRGRVESHHRAVTFSVHGVEVCHLRKRGNNVHTLHRAAIELQPELLHDYDELRNTCRNPFYKNIRIVNLLSRSPTWHEGMLGLFACWPAKFFVWKSGQEGTPQRIPFFGIDVSRKFRAIDETIKQTGGNHMNETDQDDHLALCIHRMIQSYLRRRSEEKSGVTYDTFKDKIVIGTDGKKRRDCPREYAEAREKVALDAFLAMRSRKAQDFVEYFAGTICSVPQFLSESQFLMVSSALFTNPDRVKTLAMLAVSANSKV